ncbi:hypothetical protein BD779DRAFT_1533198 [Infundibulicybe gibba]|nr:hypothetical protein BD779DRAFT_1533198 [Infundibulicybe gibba]
MSSARSKGWNNSASDGRCSKSQPVHQPSGAPTMSPSRPSRYTRGSYLAGYWADSSDHLSPTRSAPIYPFCGSQQHQQHRPPLPSHSPWRDADARCTSCARMATHPRGRSWRSRRTSSSSALVCALWCCASC